MPSKILLSFLSFSDYLLQDAYIIFQNNVDNFEVVPKICQSGLGYQLIIWIQILMIVTMIQQVRAVRNLLLPYTPPY